MVPSRPSTPVDGGGAQSAAPSLMRDNSGLLGGQAGLIASQQQPFSSMASPRTQFGGNSGIGGGLLGSFSNVSSFLDHSFANGGMVSGGGQRGGVGRDVDMIGSGDPHPLSFNSSSGPTQGQESQSQSASRENSTQVNLFDGAQNFQQQFSLYHSQQQQQQQQHQPQQLRGGLGNRGTMGAVKLEPQTAPTDQNGSSHQLASIHSLGPAKIEPPQLQSFRGLGLVKLERQHSDSSLFLHQQQQQQLLQMSRQSSQAGAAAQMNLLHQQRIMQLQQQKNQQQQQIVKTFPQQRPQLQQQLQQGLSVRTQGKPTTYEPGICARRLTQYLYHQQHRPEDNNIEFWRKFVAEYFASNAKKRWCVSLYGSGRQTTGVFPQDVWQCEICNRRPARGFETTVEVLPRLFQIKYASGTLEELLFVDMPHEYQNALGQVVLDYAKAIQESVFEQLRVVREGQLRIVFSPDLKICSWEFCARRHEELIPRKLLIPQVSQLGTVVQKYQNTAQSMTSGLSNQDLQNSCNSFLSSARQLAKALEVPLVNDLGYTKRYVRCLQISEVVNSMKDLIDYSRETGTGPMDSLINFPRRSSASSGIYPQQAQQPEEQQINHQSSKQNGQVFLHSTGMQLASANNCLTSINNSVGAPAYSSMSATGIGGLHQNSMNTRQENPMGSTSSPYGGHPAVQMPSSSSSNSLPPSQPNSSSPFPSPTMSTSNNNTTPTSHGNTRLNSGNSPANISTMQQQTSQPHEADLTDSQSSVQQILQEIMKPSQMNNGNTLVNARKCISGITPAMNGGNCLVGNGTEYNSGVTNMGFGSMYRIGSATPNGLRAATANSAVAMNAGLRAATANSAVAMNARVGLNHIPRDPVTMNHHLQQDKGSQLFGGHGSVNSFSNLQFDWRPSPGA